MWTRHLLAILALPFLGVFIVPAVLLTGLLGPDTHWPLTKETQFLPLALGVPLWLVGCGLWAWCVWLFACIGRGTLAPWSPTQNLVVVGPYRHMRNPMITGVVAMLLGEALCFGSILIFSWAIGFWVMKHIWFIASEEPLLSRRFGEPYHHYHAGVPRWFPRRTPWTPQ